jgi:hypothetical protein
MLPGLLALAAASAYAQCGPRFVAVGGSDTANNCLIQGAPCATIQHGVDVAAACPSETVNVAAGTYTEQVTISTILNLVGAGAATTTIKAPSPLAANFDIVTIGATATVELSGFRVSGPANPIGAGIDVLDGGNANIHDNTIIAVRHEPIDGDPQGVGIIVGFAGAATATITNNMVVDYQKNGITAQGTGSMGTITGNIVTGAGGCRCAPALANAELCP